VVQRAKRNQQRDSPFFWLRHNQPTMGLRIVTLNFGGFWGASAFFFSPARPLHSLDAIRVIAWPRFGYAKHRSRSHDAMIRVFDAAGNLLETHEHKGEFKEP
jgi:hypothetical protein